MGTSCLEAKGESSKGAAQMADLVCKIGGNSRHSASTYRVYLAVWGLEFRLLISASRVKVICMHNS